MHSHLPFLILLLSFGLGTGLSAPLMAQGTKPSGHAHDTHSHASHSHGVHAGHAHADSARAADAQTTQQHKGHAHPIADAIADLAPELSLVGDFVLSLSDADDNFARHNRFNLRGVELGVVGQAREGLEYVFYAHFDEDVIEIEEAFIRAEGLLAEGVDFKVGHFNLDFGRLAALHDHEQPFLDKPQVLQEYLGGAVRGSGVEAGWARKLDDATRLRASLAIVNALEGDAHVIFGPLAGHDHAHSDSGAFGDRDFENFAFNARVAASRQLSDDTTIALGASVAFAPEARAFFGTGINRRAVDLRTAIFGVDACLEIDQGKGRTWTFAAELLVSNKEHSDDGITVNDVEATGWFAYLERSFDDAWSLGLSGGGFEHAEDANEESSDYGAFLTHQLDAMNRLRLEVRRFVDPGPDTLGAALQWTITLGKRHKHTH